MADDLDRKVLDFMPNVRALMAEQGAMFDNFVYNIALCCPSRATILRGQYAHNTGVYGNDSINGGYAKFLGNGNEASTVATWLDAAGYRTGYFGKYFNGYPKTGGVSAKYVPQGWDDWFVAGADAYDGFTYRVNDSGRLVYFGSAPEEYSGDTLTAAALDFMNQSAGSGQPFFATLAPFAPHTPATPAPRHAGLFTDITYPRSPNFNEEDVSDKRSRPPALTEAEIANVDTLFRDRVRSAQSVDETLAAVVTELAAQGQLENTYIAFTSDNGYHIGEHRLAPIGGKHTPYEEDIRGPFILRGPGIPAGVTYSQLVGNVDIAPTFADAAGVMAPEFVDGRSLLPLTRGEVGPWRHNYVMQRGSVPAPPYSGLRTDRYTFVAYDSGFRELYDLQSDPYQLQNIWKTAPESLRAALTERLRALQGCRADVCRSEEEVELPIP